MIYNENMKILMILMDLPYGEGNTNLYLDLANEFYKNSHSIYIIAPKKSDQKEGLFIENKIYVLRVNTWKQRDIKSIIKKGLAQILLPYQFRKGYNIYLKNFNFDLLLVPTPPITLVKLVNYIKKRNNSLFYLILRDIYPQGAADIGLIKFKFIYYYLRKLEIINYKSADIIGCMSEGNIDYVKKNNLYLKSNKLTLLPNWQKECDNSVLREDIRTKYNLINKYIVLFGGTIGYAQKVDNIVILAEHYKINQHIVFLVIGNGVMKKYLIKKVREKMLSNVIIIDSLPRNEYLNFVRSSDIGLITIDERFTVPTIPSKTTSYLSLRLPILAIIDKHTDYGKIIDEAEFGLWSIGGDNQKLFDNFDRLYNDKNLRIQFGINGYNFFIEKLTSEIAYNTIINQIINHKKDEYIYF